MPNFKSSDMIVLIEKCLLTIVVILTLIAVLLELFSIYESGRVKLEDLLLLFIYAEVLNMVGVFFESKKIPIILPLFIAMTAIARLTILQGKDTDATTLVYQAGAILIIALACLVVRYEPTNNSRASEDIE